MGGGRSRQQAVYNEPYYTAGYPTYGPGVAPAYTIQTPPSLIETPYEQVDWTEVYVPTARASGGRRPVIYVTAPFPGGLGGYGGGFGGGLGGYGGGFGGAGGLGGYGGGFPGIF